MKKTITLLLFVLIGLPSMAESLNFSLPAYWDYVAVGDVYTYEVVNMGDAYTGKVTLYASSNETADEYMLSSFDLSIAAQGQQALEFSFPEQMGLPKGDYTFYVKYAVESGEVSTADFANTQVTCLAPAPLKIPITTTTGGYGRINLSAGSNTIKVVANKPMKRVVIFNTSGSKVMSVNAENSLKVKIDTRDLPKGSYIVQGKFEKNNDTKKMAR